MASQGPSAADERRRTWEGGLALDSAAMVGFGAPESMLEQREAATPEDVLWMGHPPVRIDIVKGVPGMTSRAPTPSARSQDQLDAELMQRDGSDAE